jgi:metal regulatory transcription factor 1
MLKHQHRAHSRDIQSSELDDVDSAGSESPPTPQQSRQLQWPPNSIVSTHSITSNVPHIYQENTFTNFGQQQIDGFPLAPAYGCRQSLSGSPQLYNPYILEHIHPNLWLLETPILPARSSYYIPEQSNPGGETLNPDLISTQTRHIPRHQPSLDILQSPSSYPMCSRAIPITHELYYARQTAPEASYDLRNSSPSEQQPAIQSPELAYYLTQPQHHPTDVQYGQLYDNAICQAPIEVVGHIHAYHEARIPHNPWIQKMEAIEDTTLQMPRVHMENLLPPLNTVKSRA